MIFVLRIRRGRRGHSPWPRLRQVHRSRPYVEFKITGQNVPKVVGAISSEGLSSLIYILGRIAASASDSGLLLHME